MAKKDRLFHLIKSLSKGEKRYFKVFVSASKENKNYLLLFDAIDRQSEYDEEKIKRKFRQQSFVRQLHVTKNYLMKLIMRSLRNYNSINSREGTLKDLLKDVEILFRKELFDQCEDVIKKASKLARDLDNYSALLELLARKRRVILGRHGAGIQQEALNEISAKEKEALEKLTMQSEYWHLTTNLFTAINAPVDYGVETLEDHPLLKTQPEGTLQSTILYYFLWQAWHYAQNDLPAAKGKIVSLVTLLESYPDRIRDNPGAYITALNNLISICLQGKELDEIPAILRKIRDIPEKYALDASSKIAVRMMAHTYNVELEMYRDNGEYEKGADLSKTVTAFLEKHKTAVQDVYRLLLSYQISYLHFVTGDYETSLFWLNEIFSRNFGDLRVDIQSYAHILRLIIHFELKNTIVLKYTVESCRRFLKKKGLDEYQGNLLRFFSKISLALPEEYTQLYEDVYQKLFEQPPDASMRSHLDYLDVKGWLERKMAI